MKKTGSIILLSFLFAFNSQAQLTFIDSSKSEIGININPLLVPLGISASTDNATLQFKHHYTNVSLRLGVTIINSNSYNGTDPRNYHFRITDSTRVFDHYYDNKNSIRLNIGLEQQQMMRNKWKFFYGFDILGGYSKDETRIERTTYLLGPDSTFSHYLTANDSVSSTLNHILIGAAFVAGFDYFFSKRISAGIQGYFPVSYEYETGNNGNKSSSINFDQKFSILLRMHF